MITKGSICISSGEITSYRERNVRRLKPNSFPPEKVLVLGYTFMYEGDVAGDPNSYLGSLSFETEERSLSVDSSTKVWVCVPMTSMGKETDRFLRPFRSLESQLEVI